jgi:hypothetical protein
VCKHDHVRFEDGTLHLVCIDCGQVWAALDRKGGMINHMLTYENRMYSPDTRHSRWEVPRLTPLTPPKSSRH